MRFISAILPFLSVCCLLPSAWGAGDMAPDLKSGVFWKLPQPDLFGKYFNGEPGGWVDKGKTQLRIAKPSIKIGDMSLGEMLVNWKDGAPHSMTVMMYNKGDNGAIGKDEFDKRLELIKESLTALTGIQPKEYRASRKEAVVKVNGWSWIWENGAITLEINTSREGREFEAEFIRMKAGPTEDSIARGDASSRARKADIKQHVRKEGKRVVIQDIPMVDQGQKGYCVVATAARIFAYYGMDYVDQHELASLANTSADGGTNTAAMAENLKKIGTRFQIRIKVLESLANSRDFRNLLKAYNRAASKLKKEKVENEHDWSGFWDNADGEVLKLARAGSPSQVDRWLNAIKPYIMAGIPVFWSVQLGIVPETGPDMFIFHLLFFQLGGGAVIGFQQIPGGPPIRRRKCRWQMPSPLRRGARSCSLPNNRCGISPPSLPENPEYSLRGEAILLAWAGRCIILAP